MRQNLMSLFLGLVRTEGSFEAGDNCECFLTIKFLKVRSC